MAVQTLMSAEEFDRLPAEEGLTHELLNGELIEVSSATPEHNNIEAELLGSTRQVLRREGLGNALPDTEFVIGGSRLRPDVAILLGEKWSLLDRRRVPVMIVPDVAAEIVSPSESAHELEGKVAAYLEAGVAEVWVIYPDRRHLYIHTESGVRRLRVPDVLQSPLLPGWSLPVADLFA